MTYMALNKPQSIDNFVYVHFGCEFYKLKKFNPDFSPYSKFILWEKTLN